MRTEKRMKSKIQPRKFYIKRWNIFYIVQVRQPILSKSQGSKDLQNWPTLILRILLSPEKIDQSDLARLWTFRLQSLDFKSSIFLGENDVGDIVVMAT